MRRLLGKINGLGTVKQMSPIMSAALTLPIAGPPISYCHWAAITLLLYMISGGRHAKVI